jgi:predicted MFS family arabinose efflux permease
VLKSLFGKYRAAYTGLPRDAWALSLILFINMSGTMVVFFLSLYMTQRLGFSVLQAGRILSVYGVGMIAGTLSGGWASDRIGPRATQRATLFGEGIALFALGFFRTPTAMAAGVFLVAFFASALFPANSSAIVEVCPVALRSRGFALNRLANNLGVTIGPVVGGFLSRIDYSLLFWADGATCILAGLAFYVVFPKSRRNRACDAPEGTGRPTAWWTDRGLLGILAGTLGISVIFVQIFGAFPLYLRTIYGFRENVIGLAVAVNSGLIVLAQMVLTHGAERFRRGRVAAVGTILLGLGFGLLPLGHGFLYAAMTVVIWTFGEMLVLPTLTTMISLRAPEGGQGKYQGLFSLAFSVGNVLGPAVGMAAYDRLGAPVLWFGVAGLAAAVASGFWLGGGSPWLSPSAKA